MHTYFGTVHLSNAGHRKSLTVRNRRKNMKSLNTQSEDSFCKNYIISSKFSISLHLFVHYFYYFFVHWHYSPLWALACRTMSFHFFPICHQLSPSSHSQHLKIPFYFLFPSFPGSSPSSRPFQFLSEDLFGHPILLPFSLGDLTSSSFALLSIVLYFLLCSSLLVLDSSDFSIPRFQIFLLVHGLAIRLVYSPRYFCWFLHRLFHKSWCDCQLLNISTFSFTSFVIVGRF